MTRFFGLLMFCAVFFTAAFGQENGSISGKIVGAENEPLTNVNVRILHTGKGTSTDAQGNFTLTNVAAGEHTLRVSSVGFKPADVQATVVGGQTRTVGTIALTADEGSLDEVLVEGNRPNRFTEDRSDYVSKMELKQLENPQVYSSISAALIASQQSYSLDQALRNSPGVNKLWDANGRAGTGGAYYTLRGFTTQATLRNGLAGNYTSTVDVSNIERVEVLKGPSGTLYGSSLPSFGGLVNRITKKPQEERFGSVTVSGGGYEFFRVAADYNTPLNEDKTVLMRMNAVYSTSGTFQDNGFRKTIGVTPSVTYKASDRLTFTVDAEVFRSKGNDFQGVYLYSTPNVMGVHKPSDTKLNYNLSYKADDVYSESDVANVFAQARYTINAHWTSQTNISLATNRSDGPGPFFYLAPNATVESNPAATGSDYLLRDTWKPVGRNRSFEIQQNFIGTFNIGAMENKLTVGLDFYNYDNKLTYFYTTGSYMGINNASWLFDGLHLGGAMPTYYNFNKSNINYAYSSSTNKLVSLSQNKTNAYSAFAIDVLKITEQLSAMASVRIDRFENRGVYSPVTNVTTADYDQTAVSPKFGLVYQVVPNKVAVFGNYQNGFENVAPVTQPSKAIENFDAKQANQWEGGVKLNLLGDKLAATFSYYDISVKNNTRQDIQQFTDENGVSQTGNFTVQDGTQVSKGTEAEIVANPIEGLNFVLGYAYNDSKWERSTTEIEGLRPINSGPQQMGNAWISYRMPEGALQGFGIGVGGNYSGKALIANTRSGGKFALPEYTVGNANVFYDKVSYRISFAVKNFTDKQYYTGFSTISPQMPRQFVADFTLRF